MFNVVNNSIDWNGRELSLETGKIARQADSSVMVKMGKSAVLCVVTFAKRSSENVDFFPLTVNYLEKYYAAGRFPGGFIKREAKPSERETLISRLIDRAIRPLFLDNFFYEVNVTCKVLSFDASTPTEIMALIGASAALSISGLPLRDIIGAVKLGIVDDEYVFNPSLSDISQSRLDLIVAGSESGVMMIESAAKEIGESKLLEAIQLAHDNLKKVVNLVKKFSSQVEKRAFDYKVLDASAIYKELCDNISGDVEDIYDISDKKERNDKLSSLQELHASKYTDDLRLFNIAFKKLQKDIVRKKIIDKGVRLDGRKASEIRPIECEVGLLEVPHGSALFTRGSTQAISIITLGSAQDAQTVDDITGVVSNGFLLHYNFPPYSVGECGILKAPGRRELGHGKLAYKALLAVLPENDNFPYTVRAVTEITESNGSSSMATICASSLAMMNAGIPIKNAVSGIAMGLMCDKKTVILSDIMGDEDALGDMDFKVASTKNGITALQMDVKIDGGIDMELLKQAISQAGEGCEHILNKMLKVLSVPNEELSTSAPRIHSISISNDKIRDLIGPGGKVIKDICQKSDSKIDIDDASGKVVIFAPDDEKLKIALNMINDIVAEPEVGFEYEGVVKKIMPFGVFVKFLGGNEGLVHISKISDNKIDDINDVLSQNDVVKVKYLGLDNRNKHKLTMKGIKQHNNTVLQDKKKEASSGDEKSGKGILKKIFDSF